MLLAVDVGTSSTRAIVYNKDGQVFGEANSCLQTTYPRNGWVEQCPDNLWENTLKVMRQALEQANVRASDIKACGLTNQRETTIVWNKNTGQVLSPAIVWQDRRTADICNKLSECSQLISDKTGLCLDPYFSATKILWLKQNNSQVQKALKRKECLFGTVDTFILWRLTKGTVHKTDASNASRTLLVNLSTGQWDEDLLTLFSVPKEILPEICDSTSHFGNIDTKWLGAAIPITGVLGDQQAATVGQRCFQPGEMKVTFGTGCFSMLNTGRHVVASKNKLLSTILYQINGKRTYALEGSLFNAGTSIKWLRDNLSLIKSSAETEDQVANLKGNEGVYFIPAFTGLGAPFWVAKARAAFVGLQLSTDKKIMIRAVLESLCYQVKALMEAKNQDFPHELKALNVDGGMTVNTWLMQYLSDCLSLTVRRQEVSEMTALGAAMFASVGAGIHSLDGLKKLSFETQKFYPKREISTVEHNYKQWLKAVETVSELAIYSE